jgi:hypothetical protein
LRIELESGSGLPSVSSPQASVENEKEGRMSRNESRDESLERRIGKMLLGAALNEWSRRTFLGRAVAAVIAIPLSKITAASPPPNPDQDALDLMRWLNTIQVGIESMNHDHKHPEIRNYGSKAEMLGNQEPGLTWQIHTHVDSLLGPKLNPDSPTGEVLPGWTLDFASKPNGYVMALVEKSGASRKAFVTDEHVII